MREVSMPMSYAHGAADSPLWYITLPVLLDQRAAETPDRDAHVFWVANEGGSLIRESISYRQLALGSCNLAASLLDLGLDPGCKVAIVADNCLEWLLVEYAVLRCNMMLIRIAPEGVTASSLTEYVEQYGCRAVFVSGRPSDPATAVVKQLFTVRSLKSNSRGAVSQVDGRVIGLKQALGRTGLTVELLSRQAGVRPDLLEQVRVIQRAIKPDDVAVALDTSGSHGIIRFITLSHFALINNARFVDAQILNKPETKYLNSSPFYWIGSNMYAAVTFGITMVHIDKDSSTDIKQTKFVLTADRITVGKFMASFLTEVYDRWRRGETILPPSLTYIISGGAPLSNEVSRFLIENKKQIMMDYGATETMTVATSLSGSGVYKECYKPIAYVEIRVEDDSRHVVPVGQPGCLWVRSPFLSKGPLAKRGETERSLQLVDGWYNTEDVFCITEAGCMTYISRDCDVIKQGQRVVYPVIVEGEIRKLTTVSEVVVIGLPPRSSDQDICACVVPASGCGSQEVDSGFMAMRTDWRQEYSIKYILILDELPRVPNGKINEAELVNQAMVHFNMQG